MSESHLALRQFVERIERLDDEIAEMRADRKDVVAEAKAQGFDQKALAEVIRRRKMDPRLRADLDCIVETYECALGGIPRGMVDGGDLRPALPAPDQQLPVSKGRAELEAWLNGGIG